MANEGSGIDRCETCGGIFKRVRDLEQAICRCDKPSRPGKRGRAPSAFHDTFSELAADEELDAATASFKPPED